MRTNGDWMQRARCLEEDPELFFPIGKNAAAMEQTEAARELCARCDVRLHCVRFALGVDTPFGVWGGLDPDERGRIRRRLVRAETT